jgi:AcrR family transcriptional regulator
MARHPTAAQAEPEDLRERLVTAGLEVLARHGPAELTVRRIAEAAGSSTMGVYSRFGGRTGILEALYRRGFDLLRAALGAVHDARDPIRRILDLGLAYRRLALDNPALYALMFERPIPDFDPSPTLRQEALESTFGCLVEAVRHATAQGALPDTDPVRTSYLVWCVTHGMVSLELTHAVRRPLPGWFLDTAEAGERILLDGLQATLSGLRGQEAGREGGGGRSRP